MATELHELLSTDYDIVEVVHDGVALIEATRRVVPDAIVCDIAMPGEDGLSFIRKVRSSHGSVVPAAALTGHATERGRALALEAGFQTYLTKPIDPARLALAVAGLLERTPTP